MQAANAAGDHPTPAVVFETLNAYQRTAALRAAIELDLFRAVGDGPATASVLAQRCAASERGVRILCDFLVIIELLAKDGDVYSHTPASAAFLDPRSPSCIASVASFLSQPDLVTSSRNMAEIVRQGRASLPGEGTVEPDNPLWVEFARSMSPMMAPMTGPLGRIVLDGNSGPMRVLDIAAGHGLFGIEVAKQNPEAHVVALDWAHVLEVALENAQNAGVTDRYELLAGSAFDVDYGGPYDVVLLTNFLHHFDVPTCVVLLKKVRASQDILGTLLLSVLAGHKRYAHVTTIRSDSVTPGLLGMQRVRSEDAVRRAFQQGAPEQYALWLARHLGNTYEELLNEPWILDMDGTVKPLYGHQEQAVVGYNPTKCGRPSHVYQTYFIAALRMVLDVEVQAGNQTASQYAQPGLWAWLDGRPRERWPALVRGDIAWGTERMMLECEKRNLPYLFKIRQTTKVRSHIAQLFGRSDWVAAGQGWQALSSQLQLTGWSRARRVVILRRRVREALALAAAEQDSVQPRLLATAEYEVWRASRRAGIRSERGPS